MITTGVHSNILWFTGLSGSGKSTLCKAVAQEIRVRGFRATILDADELRQTLCSDLDFSTSGRAENIRRIAHVADLISRTETFVLVAAICPFQHLRKMVRTLLPKMIEIYVEAPLSVCEQRDPKGLYRKARAGELKNFTGIDSPFDVPIRPDFVCHTAVETVAESLLRILDFLSRELLLSKEQETKAPSRMKPSYVRPIEELPANHRSTPPGRSCSSVRP